MLYSFTNMATVGIKALSKLFCKRCTIINVVRPQWTAKSANLTFVTVTMAFTLHPLMLDWWCITEVNSGVLSSISQAGRTDESWVFVWMTLSIAVAWVLSMTTYYKSATQQPIRLCCRYIDMSVTRWDHRDVTLVVSDRATVCDLVNVAKTIVLSWAC